MGAPPQDEEEATDAQLAALYQRVYAQKLAPYVDFAAWLPFGRRVQKNQKFRAFLPIGDGSFVMKELPGPQNLQQWTVCWRVFKNSMHFVGHCNLSFIAVAREGHREAGPAMAKSLGLDSSGRR